MRALKAILKKNCSYAGLCPDRKPEIKINLPGILNMKVHKKINLFFHLYSLILRSPRCGDKRGQFAANEDEKACF
jgi:hypothetical protein